MLYRGVIYIVKLAVIIIDLSRNRSFHDNFHDVSKDDSPCYIEIGRDASERVVLLDRPIRRE